jgi:hypothetical protein
MSPEEAAELLRVGRSTVYDLMRTTTPFKGREVRANPGPRGAAVGASSRSRRSRRLVSIKIGRRRLIPAGAVTAYIESLVADGAA